MFKMHVNCFLTQKQQYHSNRSCAAMSFTDVTIQMAISRATSELGNSALRPKQELAVGTFCEGDVLVSLPTGSGKSSCYCLLSRAFYFLRKRAALRGSIASSRLCHGPHNFEPRRNTSGNLSALPEISATTCFKGGKTNSPEKLNTFLRSDGLRKMSQQLNTLLADAIVRFRLILETMLWRSNDSLVKTAISRVRLHSFYAQKPVQIHQTYFPPLLLFSARAFYTCARKYVWLARLL